MTNDEKLVLDQIDPLEVITFCRNLIRIPSYVGQEHEKGSYVAKEMERLDLDVQKFFLEHDRFNVVGRLPGMSNENAVMICAHLDTHFPLDGQEHIAHSAKFDGGRIYGIGTGDSMSPLAAFFGALHAIRRSGLKLLRDLLFVTTVDEMTYSLGALELLENGLTAEMAIIGEPTDFKVGIVHSGRTEIEITTKGMSLYEAGPYAATIGKPSTNAVISMAHIIKYLKQMESEEPYFHQKHSMLPGEGAAFYIGPIIGGSTGYGSPYRRPGPHPDQLGVAKITPDWCHLRVGARYWPGQTAQEFAALVRKWIEKARVNHQEIIAETSVYLDHNNVGIETPEDATVVQILKGVITEILGRPAETIGNVYWTEAALYSNAGIPSAWCGGPLFRWGAADEHITADELITMTQIYALSILRACGIAKD